MVGRAFSTDELLALKDFMELLIIERLPKFELLVRDFLFVRVARVQIEPKGIINIPTPQKLTS